MSKADTKWIGTKNAKALMVLNAKESVDLNKHISTLELSRRSSFCLLQNEERKVRRNLEKLKDAANARKYSMYEIPGSVDSMETQSEKPLDVENSDIGLTKVRSEHLHNFFSNLQQPAKRLSSSTVKLKEKEYLPFSNVDYRMGPTKVEAPGALINENIYKTAAPLHTSRVNFSHPLSVTSCNSRISSIAARFQSLHGLPEDKWPHSSVSRYSASKRKLVDLAAKPWEDEYSEKCLPYYQPEEFLNCRYLRLSKTNIANLKQWCKNLEIDTDMHPHTSESEIDITTLLSSGKNHFDSL